MGARVIVGDLGVHPSRRRCRRRRRKSRRMT